MNIEEDVVETLNKTIKFYEDLDILYNSKEPCPEIRAIKWIITAYEKEKEKNKELIKERATEIVYVDRNFIRKDRIKPIQIIDLDGKIHNVYKIEEE